ncbi:unnamed protein product (macronuclear) [Paramecium tetraurelia]|uniref:SP-RING-type domain-containing protein n=1 Tax=Paramecium tetraurelia TaxID=5888 RepID=A0BTZ1_PARTE|nr:uncharacterized protein GSPATT00032240001 [Paramecium tetraurelia]CAK62008.1 unnamed protein product [Paramecium tetraurelia]|eukprot:XP_001429406.1 hypothetical protein (macronuclear) [Paramecium tetraurelia strain d4-2]
MKNQQLLKDLETFQKQLKLALPSIINHATKDICNSQYFESLFKESKPNNIQELYSQSLLRLDPHISRQKPQLEDDIQIINDFIHVYFESHFSTLQKMMLLQQEVKTQMELEEVQKTAIQESKQQPQQLTQKEIDQNSALEYDTVNMRDVCLKLKQKYYKIPKQPICEDCFCGNQLHYKQIVQCQLCDKYLHVNCLDKSYDERQVDNFTCPICTLSNMDQFCEVITTLVDPCPFKKNGLTNSKLVRFKTDCEMVDIRCIRLDSPQAAQEITWPDLGEIQLNGKKVFEFVPLSLQSCLHKRKDEKLFCTIPKNEECTLIFKESIPGIDQKRKFRILSEQLYYFAIYKTKQYTSKQLIDKIIDDPQNWMSLEQSRDFVILQINYSPAIKIIKLHISLLCCFSSSLIQTPVRGIYCTHVQCFSLESYILMLDQQIPRKWRCPICKAKIFKLQIDALQYAILKSIRQFGLQEKYSCISLDFQGNILDEFISKSIDYNLIPEIAKQINNRIPQLEKLSSSINEKEDYEIQSNSKLNYPKSIVIIQSRDFLFLNSCQWLFCYNL